MRQWFTSILLLLPCLTHAQICSVADVDSLVREFFDATKSLGCVARMEELNVDKHWLNECRRQDGPHQALHIEFAKRTSVSVKSVQKLEGKTYAVLELSGPSSTEFGLALFGIGSCSNAQESAAFPGFAPRKKCDEIFWNDIQVVRYEGALPLECRQEGWFVANPGSSHGK